MLRSYPTLKALLIFIVLLVLLIGGPVWVSLYVHNIYGLSDRKSETCNVYSVTTLCFGSSNETGNSR